MQISTKTAGNAFFSLMLLGASASQLGCDAQEDSAPQSADSQGGNSAGKSDDASGTRPDTEPTADTCAIKGPAGGCDCTYAEYKDGCGQCDGEEEDCDKGVGGGWLLECAPAVSAVAVACGPSGFGLLVDAALLDTWGALQDFWELLFDDECGWAVREASSCMFEGWLGSSSVGIMWEYDACLAQGRTDCCVADSQCYGGICGESGACFY